MWWKLKFFQKKMHLLSLYCQIHDFQGFFENFQIFAHFLSIFSQCSTLLLNFFPCLSFLAVSWQKNLHFEPKLRFLAQKLTNLEPFSRIWEKSDFFRKKIFFIKFWLFSTFLIPKWRKTIDFSVFGLFSALKWRKRRIFDFLKLSRLWKSRRLIIASNILSFWQILNPLVRFQCIVCLEWILLLFFNLG